ncbi:MAG: esterase-like activity of phytase family protein [Rhizobacter sp.]|nr:esterase-like activity of phytase family protein [Ferruginibacter sp.]
MFTRIFTLWIVVSVAACTSGKRITKENDAVIKISSLQFLDEYVIPYNYKYNNTVVGGLSGIDYDPYSNRYFIISDERSYTSPARFYTAAISISNSKIDTLIFTSVHTLKQPGGAVFPSFKQNAQRTPDPESIRYNPKTNTLAWTSEGDREVRMGKMIYQDPYVYEMNREGYFKDSFFVPANLHMNAAEKGPRENGVFEGSTFADNYRSLYVSMEAPLYEDGPVAGFTYAGAPVRITKFDTKTRKAAAQYAYHLDAVAHKQIPDSSFFINGLDEILSIGNGHFLFMERSFSMGTLQNTIKLFLVDLKGATDVSGVSALHQNKNYQPLSKTLLLNLDDLKRYVDNVEGMTLGPLLPNGNRSLILIADNNFNTIEKTQVFLLEIIP